MECGFFQLLYLLENTFDFFLLIVAGLNDPRVAYWEPAKWAQVLRHEIANGDETLVKMDMSAGHFSAADRYRYLRELAFDYAWLLDVFGKAE